MLFPKLSKQRQRVLTSRPKIRSVTNAEAKSIFSRRFSRLVPTTVSFFGRNVNICKQNLLVGKQRFDNKT